jgi:SAM-dependent methyltransferase
VSAAGAGSAHAAHTADAAPSDWVLRFAESVPAGARVLDFACGSGRHAKVFAARGCEVEAVDRDPALAAAFAGSSVRFLVADLESGPWPYTGRQFDAVIVTNYLHRPLFPVLRAALAEGGLLLYETFALGQQKFGRPTNPDFLLRPGELLDVFRPALHVIAYEDRVVHRPAPARVQRLAACAGPWPE